MYIKIPTYISTEKRFVKTKLEKPYDNDNNSVRHEYNVYIISYARVIYYNTKAFRTAAETRGARVENNDNNVGETAAWRTE